MEGKEGRKGMGEKEKGGIGEDSGGGGGEEGNWKRRRRTM